MGPTSWDDTRSSSSVVPTGVRLAAVALGLAEEPLAAFGGATGSTWACGEGVLRIGDAEDLRREMLVMQAAAHAVPVPEVLAMKEFVDDQEQPAAALLLTLLPGRPAGDFAGLSPARVRRWGEVCGRVHAALAKVSPPPGLRAAPAVPVSQAGMAPCLLHLDLHPLNVLVNEAGDVSGVLDWTNAAAGPEVLDRARTWSILTLDPAIMPLHDEPRCAALLEGWTHTANFARLPPSARAWACRFMLDDLAARYPASRLDHIRRCLTENDDGGTCELVDRVAVPGRRSAGPAGATCAGHEA
ncbi:phosphotransferase [Micromonospora sp. NPDC049460]|uniref:phosphotransferase n=1 Tax=Micromonospora sp. NPDC049460 TaxID=3364272 RepID=UPI0037A93F13